MIRIPSISLPGACFLGAVLGLTFVILAIASL